MSTATESPSQAEFATRELDRKTHAHIIELLNARLADTIDLKTQSKYAHWNVRGRDFLPLHHLFDQIAGHLEAAADTIAERIAALGGTAKGTARLVAEHSMLEEYDLTATDAKEHVRALARRLGKLTHTLTGDILRCAEYGDPVTADVLTSFAREAEKDLWFLEA